MEEVVLLVVFKLRGFVLVVNVVTASLVLQVVREQDLPELK